MTVKVNVISGRGTLPLIQILLVAVLPYSSVEVLNGEEGVHLHRCCVFRWVPELLRIVRIYACTHRQSNWHVAWATRNTLQKFQGQRVVQVQPAIVIVTRGTTYEQKVAWGHKCRDNSWWEEGTGLRFISPHHSFLLLIVYSIIESINRNWARWWYYGNHLIITLSSVVPKSYFLKDVCANF